MFTLLTRVNSVFGLNGALTGLAVAAALFFGLSSTSHATPIFFDITLVGTSGPENGTVGTGTFSIESSVFSGTGFELFCPADGGGCTNEGFLSMEFSFAGGNFSLSDDIAFPAFPFVVLIDGVWDNFNYVAAGTTLISLGTVFLYEDGVGDGSTGSISVVQAPVIQVPEPSVVTLFITGLAGLGLGLMRRRRRRHRE